MVRFKRARAVGSLLLVVIKQSRSNLFEFPATAFRRSRPGLERQLVHLTHFRLRLPVDDVADDVLEADRLLLWVGDQHDLRYC